MGKKGKKTAKQTAKGGDGGGDKKKVGPGKARRERAATIRGLEARIAALVEKLDVELKDIPVFSPIEEREECPVCLVQLPLAEDERDYMPCCAKWICRACSTHQDTHEILKQKTTFDDTAATMAATEKILREAPCAMCRSTRLQNPFEKCKKLIEERSDAQAMLSLGWKYMEGGLYSDGEFVPKDDLLRWSGSS